MDAATRKRFTELWLAGVPLQEIADELGYSFSGAARWRFTLGLPPRGKAIEDPPPPTPALIRIRCLEQQTNWTETERSVRWCGHPHTTYST